MTVLLEGAGHCNRIVCPYHAWTYDIEGQLVGASRMDRTPGFDPSELRLPELRCDVWAGWIYVNLDPDASPITERLRPLHDLVARYHMQDYVHVVRKDDVWDTNWKLLTENFMEGYHLPFTHRSTFGQWFPADETQFADECSDGFSYQSFVKNDDASYGVAPPGNTRLEGRWRNTSVLPTVYPSHMYVLAPDHLWYLSLQPREPGRVGVRFGVALAPERIEMLEDREAYVQELCEFFDRANAEDRSIVEGIFRGMQGALARPGPLSWLERQLHELTRYLARRLTGEG
jgi:phenylpropionate dioxygenase-like ring-hydroxylating dioxygenase large terminal subunit